MKGLGGGGGGGGVGGIRGKTRWGFIHTDGSQVNQTSKKPRRKPKTNGETFSSTETVRSESGGEKKGGGWREGGMRLKLAISLKNLVEGQQRDKQEKG